MKKLLGHKTILNVFLFLSISAIIILYFFEDQKVETLFGLNGLNINRLVENLSLGYITSYIFYYIVVVIKEREDKKVILPLIADYTYVMLNNITMFSNSFREWGDLEKVAYETSIHNRNINIYPSKNEINKACANINPDELKRAVEQIGRFTVIPNFFGLMLKYSHDVDYCLEILLAKSNILDLKLLKLLTSLKISRYHNEMLSYKKEYILTAKLNHNTLHSFERSFDEYYQIVREIEVYAEKNLKKYVERKALKDKSW